MTGGFKVCDPATANSPASCETFTQFTTNQAGQVTGMAVKDQPVAGRVATAPAATSDGLTISDVVAYRLTRQDAVEVAFRLTDSSYRPRNSSPSLLASLNGASDATNLDDLSCLPRTRGQPVRGSRVRHHPGHRAVLPPAKRAVRVAALHHID